MKNGDKIGSSEKKEHLRLELFKAGIAGLRPVGHGG